MREDILVTMMSVGQTRGGLGLSFILGHHIRRRRIGAMRCDIFNAEAMRHAAVVPGWLGCFLFICIIGRRTWPVSLTVF